MAKPTEKEKYHKMFLTFFGGVGLTTEEIEKINYKQIQKLFTEKPDIKVQEAVDFIKIELGKKNNEKNKSTAVEEAIEKLLK